MLTNIQQLLEERKEELKNLEQMKQSGIYSEFLSAKTIDTYISLTEKEIKEYEKLIPVFN